MSRLYRVGVLTLLILGAWLVAASSVGAAAVGAALGAGPLTISPTTVHLTYTIPTGGRKHVVTSSFAVTVTDATGTAAGWTVRAASVATLGPAGQTSNVDHAIIDFDITYANGVPPDPTCICDTIPASLGEILRTPPQTGIGRSTEKFITQLTVPMGATPGTYDATIALDVAPLGTVLPLPGGRPTGPTLGGPAPKPLPSTRPAAAGSTVSGTPAPLPASSRPVVAPTSPANGTASQPGASAASTTNDGTSDGAQVTAAPSVAVAAGSSDAPISPAAPATNSRVAAPTTAPQTIATSAIQPSGTDTASAASVADDTTPVQPVAAPYAAPSGTGGAAPTTNRVATSDATGAIVPMVGSAYPVATLVGNAVSFAPAPTVNSAAGTPGMGINWHLQATYSSAGRSATSRVFGHNAPTQMNAGSVTIVVTESGLGRATMTFAPRQADAAPTTEPAVVTISIVAGP
jgi:hypothetical protein